MARAEGGRRTEDQGRMALRVCGCVSVWVCECVGV